jgi:hypothetical protein
MTGNVVAFLAMPYRPRVGRSHVRLRDVLRTAQYLFQLIAAYNPVKLFLPLIVGTALLSLVAFAAAVGLGAVWAAAGAVMAASSALLVGLAAHAYTVSRAAASPIRSARATETAGLDRSARHETPGSGGRAG